jgi:threonine synthase
MSSTTADATPHPGTTAEHPTVLACSGCGYRLPAGQPLQLTCPMAHPDDGTDHVLRRVIDPSLIQFPVDADPNPFVRYRNLFHGYHLARAAGRSDDEVVQLIRRLDREVARVDGHGFEVTSFARADELSRRLHLPPGGGIFVKDETTNVSGSHKARHLFGVLLELELAGGAPDSASGPLAIASCGNAALAAAVVARAGDRPLQVFIPVDADPPIAARLRALGIDPIVCKRAPGTTGDPTLLRLREAIAAGAIPFTCQGTLNGLALEGGETLGWEMVSELVARGEQLDHVVIQVGGGALASSVIQAFSEARDLGALRTLPRFHTVQTRGAAPLARAYDRVAALLPDGADATDAASIESVLSRAAIHRSEFMWPWETVPHSVAGGILDDETYDWLAVVRGMLLTGGRAVVVDEAALQDANRLARASTDIDVDHTGSAGLAGAIELLRRGDIGPDERVAVIFTGIRRQTASVGEPS